MVRHATHLEERTEARLLGTLALICYSTTLAAMFVFGYTLLALTLRCVSLCDQVAYPSPCF
jgi:hypothetical protein